jgi:PAS domain S-box-containing protein
VITVGIREIGQTVKESSHLLTEQLIENGGPSTRSICSECQTCIIERFFECLGVALCMDNDAMALERIAQWAINSRHHYAQIHFRTQPANFPSQAFHAVLLDFVESHIKDNLLSSTEIISIAKRISFFINHAAQLFTSPSNHKLLHDLEDSGFTTNEERITIKELSALKNALKEATILSITDKDDRITYANELFCKITKYSIEELIGKTHEELLFSGVHDMEFFADIKRSIDKGQVWTGEICNRARDGTLYWVDTTIVPFLDNKGVPYEHIAVMFDVTEKKQTEDMLHKTEKLSLVGELAAGFAHEIRNPLTTIRGFVQIMNSFTDEKRKSYSHTILEEIDRINHIVSEFMVFAKPHAVKYNQCNLSEIIRNVVSFLSSEATMKNVDIKHDFHDDEVYIFGEKHQLTQVFLNMIKNAMDALPNGGNINLSYTICNDEIYVSIKDNGIGMTKEQVEKIGQPFFTTKEKGTGLGLMVSYKIIANHRGRISVTSVPDKGTTFMIIFPELNNFNGD